MGLVSRSLNRHTVRLCNINQKYALQSPFRRSYLVPSFDHLQKEKGLNGLYSEKGLSNAWFDRVELYTEKLNELVSSSSETRSIESMINESSKSYAKRDLVNCASMLYSLKFVNSSLRGSDKPLTPEKVKSLHKSPVDISLKYSNEPLETGNQRLQGALQSSFGSLVEFRTLLLSSNLAISGEGFTWLVARLDRSPMGTNTTPDQNQDQFFDQLFVVNTYNAGTPFNSNKSGHMVDLKKQLEKQLEEDNSTSVEVPEKKNSTENLEDIIEASSYQNDVTYVPLLAIDASPKCWLHDYGALGKQQYLDNVWESIEWSTVESRLPNMVKTFKISN
ncbi:hypothetical protein Kpol_1059p37 [Vanderwaltozyma polyspora DSM 70294]|uniref:Manganese/iron superoxide dismutase C-terminal domain-containing protein n=1 Tax=Vanderwaltozyma polyspora (strain ATCC 22028 / DSM 70294 / BCRC 21397 / CBS 2163 / NBRC 10782 / NRRL Y-8283 / UCD 57-17) TaxID=436907 RepID=A7TN41_VANPO|nr:uncharacterized protein Kpol_1059p37 [Vanderwaltozyma polyspora DSM 70294]EDO16347.1 hypothetical protein Kpol_1059p37 [Vanderwaltozyma polyspora DSM 70294]